MKVQSCLQRLLISVAAIGLTAAVTHADETPAVKEPPGAIIGSVRNSDKVPVSGATITAVRADGGAIRAALSGSDGVYLLADLPPGQWTLTLQVDGYPEVTLPALQVVPKKATRYDIVANVSAGAAGAPPAPPT